MQRELLMPKVLLPFRTDRKAQPYADALLKVGIEPLLVHPDAPRALEDAAGLLLAGGVDIDPSLYGAAAEPETEEPDKDRDRLELDLLTEALERDLPVLAICRGHQLLNVHQGGTLLQHIASGKHEVRDREASEAVHAVTLADGSILAGIFGETEIAVNSRHHQAVQEVAPGLRIAGRSAADGIVEALEHPLKRFVVSVQWHPEDQIKRSAQQLLLFEAFARAVAVPL
jgi:putative glutamine amidotransferase